MGVLKPTSHSRPSKPAARRLLQTGSALAVVLMLGACSSVPDAINPVEWGKSIGNAFDGQDTPDKSDKPIPGQDQDYPNLADTPDKPIVTGDKERDSLIAGLAADRANAQYSGNSARQSSDPVNPLSPPAPAPSAPAPAANTDTAASSAQSDATASAQDVQASDLPAAQPVEPAPAPAKVEPVDTNSSTGTAPATSGSGSRIVDQWNAKAAEAGGSATPTPKAEPVPPKPEVLSGDSFASPSKEPKADAKPAPAAPDVVQDSGNNTAAAKSAAAAGAAAAANDAQSGTSASQSAPAPSGDPVMTQYQRRLKEGNSAFNDHVGEMPSQSPNVADQNFDYSMYSDNGSVMVDESQLGGSQSNAGSGQYVGDAGFDRPAETPNEVLAARLGVLPIEQAGQGANSEQIAQIQFGFGSSHLGGTDDSVLGKVADAWKKHPQSALRVIGHASMRTANMTEAEHNKVNRQISERRASAVVSKLLSLGVNPDAIFVGADGSSDPRYFEGVPAGEAGNRRVEIFMDY